VSTLPGAFEIGRDGPGVLVVGVDGSTTARDALAYAVGMGRREGSELIIVQVGNPVSPAAAAAAFGGIPFPPADEPGTVGLDPAVTAALDELIPGRWHWVTCDGDLVTTGPSPRDRGPLTPGAPAIRASSHNCPWARSSAAMATWGSGGQDRSSSTAASRLAVVHPAATAKPRR
jgi:hypothetical protein